MPLRPGPSPLPKAPTHTLVAKPVFPAVPVLAATRPREIDHIRRLLRGAMVFCTISDALALYRFIVDRDPMMMGAMTVLTYLLMQAMISPRPLGRGARWAWTWTTASAVFGLAGGVSVTAMGLMWLSSQPLVLPVGVVWTGLYYVAILLLVKQRVRAWIFA